MNKIATELFAKELEKIGFKNIDKSSDILWHCRKDFPQKKGEFRNYEKSLCIIENPSCLFYFNAGKKVARTGEEEKLLYSIRIGIRGKIRYYRCKHFYEKCFYARYFYNESLDALMEEVKKYIIEMET